MRKKVSTVLKCRIESARNLIVLKGRIENAKKLNVIKGGIDNAYTYSYLSAYL